LDDLVEGLGDVRFLLFDVGGPERAFLAPTPNETAEEVAVGIAQDFPLLDRDAVKCTTAVVFVSFVDA
jgi:hypothetical protein